MTASNKSTFAAALNMCGLSQTEAAEFLGVSVNTIKSWGAGRNPVPAGVWLELGELWENITIDGPNLPDGAVVARKALEKLTEKG